MDIFLIGGLILGFGFFLIVFIIEKGNFVKFLQILVVLIVFGGIIVVVFVLFLMLQIKIVVKYFKMVFMDKKIDFVSVVEQFVQFFDRV